MAVALAVGTSDQAVFAWPHALPCRLAVATDRGPRAVPRQLSCAPWTRRAPPAPESNESVRNQQVAWIQFCRLPSLLQPSLHCVLQKLPDEMRVSQPARLTRISYQGPIGPRVGVMRVRRHSHHRARSAPQCGVSRGPRAYRVRVPIMPPVASRQFSGIRSVAQDDAWPGGARRGHSRASLQDKRKPAQDRDDPLRSCAR